MVWLEACALRKAIIGALDRLKGLLIGSLKDRLTSV